MAYTVDLPDGRVVEFPDSVPREEAAAIIRRQLGIGKQPESGFLPALRAGAVELGGAGSALMGRLGLKDVAKAEEEYQAAKKRAGEIFKPTEEGWTEAPVTKFTELLGGSLPYMAAPLAVGAAAAAAPVSVPTAALLGLGAAGLTSAGQFTATNLARQMEGEEGAVPKKRLAETDLAAAAAAAVPMALLDTLSMRMIPGIGRIFGQAGVKITAENAKAIAEQGLKKTLADYAVKTGKTAGIEGATEAAQQVFERLQAGLNITDPKAREEYFESFLGGAILGGTLAVPGRAVERGKEKREARGLLETQAQEERAAAAKAEEERKKSPEYLLDLETRYKEADAERVRREAEVAQRPKKGADPAQWIEYNQKVAELKEFKKENTPLNNEYTARKAEIAKLKEQRRIEGLSPLEYQMEQYGVDLRAPEAETRVFTGEGPPPVRKAPEEEYAQQQMQLAQQQDMGTFDVADYAAYLMQDPAMAQRLVDAKTPIPGLDKKTSNAVLGGLKLQLQAREKEARAATAEQLQQQQADLKAQQPVAEEDPLTMWKESVEETEDQATEELLRPNFETLRPTGPATVAVAPGITPMQNPDVLLRRVDDLVVARDRAAADADTAFATGNKELGARKAQEREAAQSALNQIEQTEGPGRALLALRKAQDTALMDAAALIDDLKAGRTLGGPEAGTASSTPKTLVNQINQQRDAFITAAIQEAAATRRLFAKSLTQEEAETAAKQMRDVFNEWVTRSMAQPRSAALEAQVVQPAQVRGTEVVRGAQTEMVDPRPLEARRFGAYREATHVLQEQLRQIASRLSAVPKEGRRVEPTLKMQFPETEAAKVAEASGETAKTLEGSLRRRRDYVEGLIDQAFQTRRVPGIAEVLLTRARDFMPKATGSFLDAAENIASRVLRGQNIERSDLVTMRDELRAASARPGEAEVAGEREGQRELFPAETRRAELGVIRETRRNFENAPIVRKSRALLAKGNKLAKDINAAWDEMSKRAETLRKAKVGETEADVSRKREAYRETFSAALARYRVEEAVAPIQKQINDTINTLAAIGKQRTKALRLKDKEAAADLDVILQAERDALVELRQQLDAARTRPGAFVEPAEMPRGAAGAMRDATLPYEIKALTDEWVVFERERLAKAEAKLEKLKGAERQEQSKAVTEQRKAVVEAEQAQRQAAIRAQQGLGLPGVRRVAGKTAPIKAEAESAAERQEAEAERRREEREAAETRRQEKETQREALEQRILDIGTERAEKVEALKRARSPESKKRLAEDIRALDRQAEIAQAQLETFGETKPRRKGPAMVPTGTALGKRTPLRTGYRKALESAAEGMRREREETVELPGTLDFGPQEQLFPREAGPQYETRDLTDLTSAALEAVKDGDIRTALADLEKNGSTQFVRDLAKRLGDMTMRTRLEVRDDVKYQGDTVEGLYDSAENKVLLHSSSLSEETLTHELTHAATMRALEADPATLTPEQRAARREIEAMHAAIQKQPDFVREYGRKDVKEFVSELMSNASFRNKLDAQKPSFIRRIYDAFMRLLGFPRTLPSAQAVKATYALFMPAQKLKAASAASARRGAPGLSTANRVADSLIAKEKGWVDKLRDNFLGAGFRTQFIDKLYPTEEALRKGGTDPTKALQAMYYLRMHDQRMHFTSQSVIEGVPELATKTRRDGQTERVIETKPGANILKIMNILKGKDVVKEAGSPDAANKLFTLYLAARRADSKGYDKLNFKVKEADIKAARAEIEANPTLKKAFDEARDIYNQYNRNLLEFSVQTGAMSRELANKLLAENDYIPYYRMRDGVAELIIGGEMPVRIGNLKDSPHLKELVGGDEAIFDFLTSSVQNTSMLLDMATRNLAVKNLMFEFRDVGLATVAKVPKSGKTPEGAVTFKRDGEDYFAVVDTDTLGISSDLLVKGLAGIPTMFPSIIRVLGVPARILRRLVVASPVYMARQLFRDTLAATLTSGADMVPVMSALKQIGKPKALQSRGITGGQVFTGMPEDQTRILKDMQAGKISLTNGLAWLEAKSAQLDALTREAQYASYREQGLSEMEATLMALESMNFSKRGLSPTIHMASTIIPFFNAQIQGLDVLYKAFAGKMPLNERLAIREKLWTRGMMLFGLSAAYAMAMQDDEAYQNASPEEKYGNWFVRLPGVEQPVRLPIPFELGYIFKALPEAMVNIMMNDKGGEEAGKAFKHIVTQMVPGLSSYFLPQAVKPGLEALIGTSLYTQRSIESAREQMMEPGLRYRDNTTALAREVGELTGFSPIKMEFLIRGYFGTLGMTALAALSAPLGSSGPEGAEKRLSDLPLVGTIFQPNDASGIINATYERMKQINTVKETYEGLLEKGRTADAEKYLRENINEMSLASVAGNFRQTMGEITKYENAIKASNMSPEEKRQQLDQMRQLKIQIAKAVRELAGKKEPQSVPA